VRSGKRPDEIVKLIEEDDQNPNHNHPPTNHKPPPPPPTSPHSNSSNIWGRTRPRTSGSPRHFPATTLSKPVP
jgi:hypothetical protein